DDTGEVDDQQTIEGRRFALGSRRARRQLRSGGHIRRFPRVILYGGTRRGLETWLQGLLAEGCGQHQTPISQGGNWFRHSCPGSCSRPAQPRGTRPSRRRSASCKRDRTFTRHSARVAVAIEWGESYPSNPPPCTPQVRAKRRNHWPTRIPPDCWVPPGIGRRCFIVLQATNRVVTLLRYRGAIPLFRDRFAGSAKFCGKVFQFWETVVHPQNRLRIVDVYARCEGQRRQCCGEDIDKSERRMIGHQMAAALRAIFA